MYSLIGAITAGLLAASFDFSGWQITGSVVLAFCLGSED